MQIKPSKKTIPPLRVRRSRPTDWEHIRDLFGEKGAFGGCWCMWMRVPRGGKEWEAAIGRTNNLRFKKLVEGRKVHAVLAFSGKLPVGWCTYGPRDSFPRIQNMPSIERKTSPRTWSVVCFYIRPAWRGKGVASRLLEAATRDALKRGASEVEGFPVTPKSGKIPNAFAWNGLADMFRKQGYKKLRRPPEKRAIFIRRRPEGDE